MVLWEFIAISGIVFVLLEIFIPTMFFLNFAVAAFCTAAVAAFTSNVNILVSVFFVLSFLSFAFLRPFLLKGKNKDAVTGMEDKYIGKIVKVIKDVSQSDGSVSVYDERWDARTEGEEIIPVGSEVRIIKNDGLILYVEKK